MCFISTTFKMIFFANVYQLGLGVGSQGAKPWTWSSVCPSAGILFQLNVFSGRISLPCNQYAFGLPALQATSPHQSQQSTVDVGQLHDPQTYTQHAIQVQHIQVTEPTSSTPASSQVGSPTVHQGQRSLGDPGTFVRVKRRYLQT